MKKFFRNNLKTILAVGATAVICISGTAFAAFQYNAKQVEYKDGKSVEEALNDLYNKSNENNEVLIKEFRGINAHANTDAYSQMILDVKNYNYISFDSITAMYTNKFEYFRIRDISENIIFETNELTSTKQIIDISNIDTIKLEIYAPSRQKAYDIIYVNNIKLYK